MRSFTILLLLTITACGGPRTEPPPDGAVMDAAVIDAAVIDAAVIDAAVMDAAVMDDAAVTTDAAVMSDAAVLCGNGVVDPGESCDTEIATGAGACPESCDDTDACTTDSLVGTGCDAECTNARITTCVSGDGCCGVGCTSVSDAECVLICDPGTADCDGVFDNGCEVDITSSATDCGACGVPCGADQECSERRCVDWPMLDWTREHTLVGGTGSVEFGSLGVGPSDEIVVSARFRGTVDVEGATLDNSVSGEMDGYLASYDAAGVFRWALRLDAGTTVRGGPVTLDAAGNTYATFQELRAGGWSSTLVSVNPAGTLRWTTPLTASRSIATNGLTVDALGRVYAVGYNFGTTDFGDGPVGASTDRSMFLASYASDTGALRWARPFVVTSVGGAPARGAINDVEARGGIVFVTGFFDGIANLGDMPRSSSGDGDAFVAAFSDPGAGFRWARVFDGSDAQSGRRLEIDGSGRLFMLADVRGSVSFGGATITDSGGFYATDAVACFDSAGVHVWSARAGDRQIEGLSAGTTGLWLGGERTIRHLDLATGSEIRSVLRGDGAGGVTRALDLQAREPRLFIVDYAMTRTLIRGYRTR